MFRILLIIGCCWAFTGCVVPRALEVEGDAGTYGRPVIDVNLSSPPFGDLTEKMSSESRDFHVWVSDPDSKRLNINVFLRSDYTKPVPVSKKEWDFTDTTEPHGIPFKIQWLCRDHVKTTNVQRVLELHVSDGGFVNTGDQRVAAQENGNVTSAHWQLTCVVN